MKRNIAFLLVLFILPAFAKTVVKKENERWRLTVNDQPFDIKGVTFGEEVKRETIGIYLKDLKSIGVNTIRLWGTNNNTKILLDSCEKYGIKVMMGIWMRHGRPGMEGDDSFDYLSDSTGMKDMYRGAIETVLRYRAHPAVLFWGVGNEVYLNIATDKEKLAYSKLLEKICAEIKKVDPDHPVCSVEAWNFGLKWWKEYVPSVDIYGINVYGEGAARIPDEMAKLDIDKPYVITEFGVNGEWEAKEDKNGVRTEPGDKQKYDVIAKGYPEWIKSKPACLGVYVFHYEHGEHFGASWLLFYYGSSYRPAYWATREAFTGKKPINNVPVIEEFALPDTSLPTGSWIPVKLKVTDVEKDVLEISFHYNQRTGGRARRDQINILEYRGNLADGFQIRIPDENGPIKVYVFVKDSYNNLGIAHTSYMINNGKTSNFIPGARVKLPFTVYDDGKGLPYIPSAYMGNYGQMKVDMENKDSHKGKAAIKVTYEALDNWFGIGMVDPVNDWGDRPGGYNFTGAKKYTFWAKSTVEDAEATIGYGMIGNEKPYYDTDKRSIKISLSTEWEKYEIDLKGADLHCIKTGFTLFSGGIGQPFSIFIDEIKFE